MADANFPLTADEADDLPRTLRRQREEMDAKARERAAAAAYGTPEPTMPPPGIDEGAGGGVSVRRFEVPFLHLVAFFLKAALAAIPAIILLGLVLWGVGHLLQMYFPQLLKMQILVWFPNNP